MELTEALKGSAAESFVKMVKLNLQDVRKSFFEIGFRLNEANDMGYYKELGYETIEDLAEEEFGFKRSTTYGLIKVFNRFAVRSSDWSCGLARNEIRDEYKDYSYSQLLEISKCTYIPVPIANYIPVNSSIRDIAEYVKEYNKNPDSFPTLPKWKELKSSSTGKLIDDLKQLTSDIEKSNAQLKGQMSIEEVNVGEVVQEEVSTENAVQTSGLRMSAEPEEKTPKYNFTTRAGVRAFLNDCLHWKEKECYSPFIGCHYYTLKNKRHIYVYIQRTASKNSIDGIYEVIHRFFIDLNQYSDVPVEITKEQFERYCAEHKDEL